MRNRSQTTPRRRGPKMPLPRDIYEEQYETTESPYYTIDNTEDIYGTTLLPSQRCYVDPWDLENYDYVRKKISATPPTPECYYETSLPPSPTTGESVSSKYYYVPRPTAPSRISELKPTRMAATMPHNRRRSHFQCQLECCNPVRRRFEEMQDGIYDINSGKYDDYMLHMTGNPQQDEDDIEQNIYTGYGGFSSSSSTERHSSIGDESVSTILCQTPGYGAKVTRRRHGISKPAPRLDFPAPPSVPPPPPTYDYCNPYATLPYCSVSDCYECLSQAHDGGSSLIYAAPSMLYGSTSYYGGVGSSSTLGRPSASSLYGGIYANKFGLSKKGLLQIDYSCSWNDLDRVIRRNY